MDIRIPFLNAFKLRITGNITSGTHTEAADMNVVRNLIVNFVRRGRIFQAHGIDVQGRIVILNLGTLPSGTYGVELVGYYNGEPWRFFKKDVFEIVRQNSDATPAGSGDVPTYDVTFELNFGGESVSPEYVDAAIAAHDADGQAHADIREALQTLETELRQEIAEAGEVNDVQIDGQSILDPETKVANIDSSQFGKVDDVKVNGISVLDSETKEASINITASVVADDEPGTPAASATMQDGNINIEFEHVKGEKGDKGDKGDKGEQGDSAVYDPDDPDTPVFVMANNMGTSTVKSMTQKAVTKAIEDASIAGWESVEKTLNNVSFTYGGYIDNSGVITASSNPPNKVYYIGVNAGDSFKIAVENAAESPTTSYAMGFSQSLPTLGGSVDVDARTSESNYEYIVHAPYDGYFVFYVKEDSASAPTTAIETYAPLMAAEVARNESSLRNSGDIALGLRIDGVIDSLRIDVASLDIPSAQTDFSKDFTGKSGRIVYGNDPDTWGLFLSQRGGCLVDISDYRGMVLKMEPQEGKHMYYAFLTAGYIQDGEVYYCQGTEFSDSQEPIALTIPNDAVYLYFDVLNSRKVVVPKSANIFGAMQDAVAALSKEAANAERIRTYHVDETNGSDTNDGLSESTAFKTFAQALSVCGIDVSIVLHGDITGPLAVSGKRHVSILSKPGERARIVCGTPITQAESVAGYNGVLKAAMEMPSGYSSGGKDYGIWLWQHDVPDTDTEIAANEIHPLQNNRTYRLQSTRLSLAESIQAVSDNTHPSYYYDGNDLYFKIAEGTTLAENPVYVRMDGVGISISSESLRMVGIECWYGYVETFAQASEMVECAAMFGINGFRWSGNRAVKLTRCESGGVFSPSGNGDGFGSGIGGGSSTLIDCWAHDCFDDGYSEHAGSRSTIIGGLYEYCGKGGMVPASGCVLTVVGSIVRKCQGNGVSEGSGIAASGGAKVTAFNVLALYNGVNFKTGSGSGENANFMSLVGCKSVGGIDYGYYANTGSRIYLYNCTDKDSTSVKGTNSTGQINVNNGTLVE